MNRKLIMLGGAITLCHSALSIAQDDDSAPNTLETVTIIGSKAEAQSLAGSGNFIDHSQFSNENITDINQVLKTVPGVYIREEDGYGLRPNIGIRGATSDRSKKITLLEDGVLIAPAPYSAPAAYYFPTAMRIDSIEVLKGAPLLREGPQTTGGVINMISTPIPSTAGGLAQFSINQRGSMDLMLNYGATNGQWGYLLETVQRDYEGYKDIDRSNQDSGFEIQDYVAKVSWQDDRQQVLLKLQYSEENSNETYFGLSDNDFKRDPNRRYGLSEIDNMDTDHTGINLSHSMRWSDNLDTSVTAYYNAFNRTWFKLNNGTQYIEPANDGSQVAQDILDGTRDLLNIQYKDSAREYISQGIQANANWLVHPAHELNIGMRLHYDEADRFQPVSFYNQIDGQLQFDRIRRPSVNDNRIDESNAVSFWLTDQYQVNQQWLINLAARYENVETESEAYADGKPRRQLSKTTESDSEEWMLGISTLYDIDQHWSLLAGFHQGMSPIGAVTENNDEDPETSDNFEAGLRFNQSGLFVEAIAFYSEFSNKIKYCSVANPCGSQEFGSEQKPSATISGLEFQLGYQLEQANFLIPIDVAYTYTNAEYDEDADDGSLEQGDYLIDIPENTASLRIGLEHLPTRWNNYVVAKFTDSFCTAEGCNRTKARFSETDALTTVDWISRYTLAAGPELFVKFENLFDEQVIVARNPYGARPNLPFTATAGVRYEF